MIDLLSEMPDTLEEIWLTRLPHFTVTHDRLETIPMETYRIRSLKVTALVDTKSQYIYDVHCTTTKKHDANIGLQVARCDGAVPTATDCFVLNVFHQSR